MKEEKKDLHCNAIYEGDKAFKRAARTKQSNYRAEVLEVGYDSKHRYGKHGRYALLKI